MTPTPHAARPGFGHRRPGKRAEQRLHRARAVSVIGVVHPRQRIDVSGEEIGELGQRQRLGRLEAELAPQEDARHVLAQSVEHPPLLRFRDTVGTFEIENGRIGGGNRRRLHPAAG